MLAQDYHKHKNKIKFPCFVQPKLDGYRMIYDSTYKTMTTRQGKEFTGIKFACELYTELCEIPKGYILDGELYVHGQSFENLGVLRKQKLNDKDKSELSKIEYHVYDMINANPFEKREQELNPLFVTPKNKIKKVPTFQRTTENEIMECHQKFTEEGYEGTMVRNANSKYLEKNRSYDLLKLKDFMDAEFEIVDFTFEKDTSGEDKNCIVWVVKVKEGVQCKVRPRGERQQRQELYEQSIKDFTKFKGRKLWTKFFDYTTDGSLRFPTTKTEDVTTYIRDEIV
jgi:DNA ligase-1